MDIESLAATNMNTANTKTYVDTSSRKFRPTKVQSNNEDVILKQQAIKEENLQRIKNEARIQEEEILRIETEEYLKKIIRITDNLNRKLKYSIDRELDQIVVKVVDAETDKIIKEIPPKELKRLYVKMKEAIGSIVDTLI